MSCMCLSVVSMGYHVIHLMYVLVIYVNISIVGLILLPSMFQISSTMEWHGLEDVEPLQDAKDKGLAQAQSTRLYFFYFQ